MGRRFALALFLAAAAAAQGRARALPPPQDDRFVTVRTGAHARERREQLVRYLWGDAGMPRRRVADEHRRDVRGPLPGLAAVRRVDELVMDLAPGLRGLGYHFIPSAPNGDLVVVHQGHACGLADPAGPGETGHGLQRTITALLGEGYGVLALFMPRRRPGDCGGSHEELFLIATAGNPMRFFLEPLAIGLNHVRLQAADDGFAPYRRFHAVGFSGGGWTVTVYAALDPGVTTTISVAGTSPLYLRTKGSRGDREQHDEPFYRLAGYPDLYVMGSLGPRRRQLQVVNRHDNCCFGEGQHDHAATGLSYAASLAEYETRVRTALLEAGPGEFSVVVDDEAPGHLISRHAIQTLILPALRQGR